MRSEHAIHENVRQLTRLVYLTLSCALLFGLTTAILSIPACTTAQMYSSQRPEHVLRVRGLIVVDEQGRERIAIGAPWPSLHGRASKAQGVGMLIVDSTGVDRVNVAAPAPDPPGVGERIAPANGLTFYDQRGNERGGVGYLDNGRSVLVLDNNEGEGAGVFSFDDGYVGVGLLKEGQFRALLDLDPETEGAGFVLNDSLGRPRVRIMVSASGTPSWELLDEQGNVIKLQ